MNLHPKPLQWLFQPQRSMVLLFALLLLTISQGFAQPKITSLLPSAAAVGSSVLITGNSFSSIPSENIVWFGPVRANVLSADPNSLTVSVPDGAGFQPVTVSVGNLTGASPMAFTPTFAGCPGVGTDFYYPKTDISTGTYPAGTTGADFDGDGRVDLITFVSNAFSVYRNTSTPGNLSFASNQDFPDTSNYINSRVICNDINGDGKIDVLFFKNNFPSRLEIFINTSTPGNVSFAALLSFPLNFVTSFASVADLDGDGKQDLVMGNSNNTQLFVMKNTSVGAVPAFAAATGLSMSFFTARGVVIDDFNKDGKPDIAALASDGQNDSVFVFTNNSSIGSISFLPRLHFSNGFQLGGSSLVSGDLDGDGFPDLAIVNNGITSISLLMNSGSTAINFGNRVQIPVSAFYFQGIAMADLNGDGLPDIVTSDQVYGLSVFRNMSSLGNFLFSPKVDFKAGDGPREIVSADLDGDGKTDLTGTNLYSNTISIFRPVLSSQIFLVDSSKTNSTPVALCSVTSADWNNASNDLQAVINIVHPGDQIWVAAGTYFPLADSLGNKNPADPSAKTFYIKNGARLYGGFRGIETAVANRLPVQYASTLSGKLANSNTVVSFSNCDSSTVLNGFTIADGSASVDRPGAGFRLLQSAPVISNCIITRNSAAGKGAAFYLQNSSATIVNCRISGNSAASGAALDLVGSNAKLINSTIAKNAADTAAGLLLEAGSAPVIANSIIYGNINKNGNQDNITPAGAAIVSYSMIAQAAGVYPGTGNMNANPIFIDAAHDDFSPVIGSPAVGTGNPAAYPASGANKDMLGNLVINQGIISIGAFQAGVPALLNAAKVYYVNQQSTAVFPTGLSWNDAFSNLNDALILSNASGLVQQVWVAKGSYTPTHGLTGLPVANTSSYPQATFLVRRIKLYGGFSGTETSPDQRNVNANTTLLDGFVPNSSGGYRLNHIVYTMGTDEVTIDGFSIARGGVGDGNYGGGSLLALNNPIIINNCKIFENHRESAVWIFGAPATISNSEFWDNTGAHGGSIFTTGKGVNITNCYFHDNITAPPGYSAYYGGAIKNQGGTMTITNTRFERLAAVGNGSLGGAVYSGTSAYDSASCIIKNCWFSENQAPDGSAVYNSAGFMSLTNCVMTKNIDNNGFIGYGPVTTFSGRLELTNCTITNNTGTIASGIVIDGYNYSPPLAVIKNTIIWGNNCTTNPRGVAVWNRLQPYYPDYEPGYNITNSNIGLTTGVFAGTGNINADPQFADTAAMNLNLKTGSPCINTGNNASYTGNLAADTTLDGAARLVGDTIDIGAMEYNPAKISGGRLGICTNYSPVVIDATTNNSWVSLTDDEGNLVAAIKANGNNLGMVNYGLFVRDGSPREDAAGVLYLNRNVIINPAVQPATPVDLRIYITKQEFESLRVAVNSKGAGSGIDSINDIAFYKNENHLCDDAVEAATSVVTATGKLYANGYVLTASIPSFSAFYMASVTQSALPLSLLSFSGRQVSGNVALNWVTTYERNTNFFSVEKSADGSHFESIGKSAAKNSPGENNYSFIDTAAFSGSIVYYRLRQVDLDGKFVYSQVILIRGVTGTKGFVTVFPNPVKDIIQLQLNLPVRQQIEWTITDNAGRVMQHGKIAAPDGALTTSIVPHGLSNGVYYFALKGSNFEKKVKLIKIN